MKWIYFLKKAIASLITIFSFFSPAEILGQDWAKTNIKETQRVDIRDLGYPNVNEIPPNSSAISSLITARDGKIYGATSGEQSYLFVFDPAINKVRHLGKIADQQSVHHSLLEGADGCIYIGTGKDIFKEIEISRDQLNIETVDKSLWKDIKKYYNDYKGGHLYKYNPVASNEKVKLPGMKSEIEDLGIPFPGNSVYALTVNHTGDQVYGITYPDGQFFTFNIKTKNFTLVGELDKKIVFHGPERYWRSLSRALICDDSGRVYMSGTDGIINYYDPILKKIVSTQLKIPGDYYYNQFFQDYAVIEYFAKSANGLIYGGTSDGYLFSLDTYSMKIINLGKPRASRRLRCLTVGLDGIVYMIAGERSASKPCQFYSFDPKSGGFQDLGLLIADRSPYYYWRGLQFDSMTTGKDGTIFLGESERRSHLFLYIP